MLTDVNYNTGYKSEYSYKVIKMSTLDVLSPASYKLCKILGKTDLEDLQEGSDVGSGWSVVRWLGLIFGVLLVVGGCCCAAKLFGVNRNR